MRLLCSLTACLCAGVSGELIASDGDIKSGKFSLLFCAPEAVVGPQSGKWRETVAVTRIIAITIDEAHCVSKAYNGAHFQTYFTIQE